MKNNTWFSQGVPTANFMQELEARAAAQARDDEIAISWGIQQLATKAQPISSRSHAQANSETQPGILETDNVAEVTSLHWDETLLLVELNNMENWKPIVV